MNGSIQKNLRERLRCKRSSRFFITFLSLFCLIPTGFTQSPTPGPLDDLHPFLEMVRDDLNIPGIAVVVVGPETNMQIYTSGYCETDGSVPIDAHTRFHLASLTKTFNATLAAALVDEGLLSWDTRVKDVIPEFELSDPMASEHATLRDLLCHRVGIGRNSLPSFNRWESPEWWLPRLVHLPFESSFRDNTQYSGVMVTVSGIMLARTAKSDWESLLKNRLLEPLNMQETTLGFPRNARNNIALGYVRESGRLLKMPTMHYGVDQSNSGLYSSASDIGQWIRFLLGSSMGNDEADRWPVIKNLSETTTPQAVIRRRGSRNQPDVQAYGLGWKIWSRNGSRWVYHAGGGPGYTSQMVLLPDNGTGVAVLTNSAMNPAPDLICTWVIDRLSGIEPSYPRERIIAIMNHMDKTSSSALDQALSKKVKDAVPAHKLSEYIGVYMNDLYGQVNVTLSETGINLMFHELPLQTFHLQNDDFMAYHPLMGTVPFHFSFRAENGVIGVHLSLSPRTEAVFFRRNG